MALVGRGGYLLHLEIGTVDVGDMVGVVYCV